MFVISATTIVLVWIFCSFLWRKFDLLIFFFNWKLKGIFSCCRFKVSTNQATQQWLWNANRWIRYIWGIIKIIILIRQTLDSSIQKLNVVFLLVVFDWYIVNIGQCWTSCKRCYRCWISAYWYSIFVRKWSWSWQCGTNKNSRGRHQTRRYLHYNKSKYFFFFIFVKNIRFAGNLLLKTRVFSNSEKNSLHLHTV